MDRRTLLQLSVATALSGFEPVKAKTAFNVVIAGAGIVGASIAYHLANAGVSVTVIDKEGPATHASRGTFAWVNATWAKQPRHYHQFSQRGVANWHSLQKELGIPIRWGGSLEWFANVQREEKLVSQIAEQVRWGEPARMLSEDELSELEPNLSIRTNSRIAYSPNDGAVDPVRATQLLLEGAEKHGAKVIYPCELVDLKTNKGRLDSVITSKGVINADRLVLATGAAANMAQQFAGVEVPQRSTPGAIFITKPMQRVINRIIVAPEVHLHQRDDGRLVIGEQAGAPDTKAHAQRLVNRPKQYPSFEIAQQHANRVLEIAKRFVPKISEAKLDDAYIGWRPLPLDGHPVIGNTSQQPDVYLAIMHSGVSLAPIVGELAAKELVTGESMIGMDNYRPSRAFNNLERY